MRSKASLTFATAEWKKVWFSNLEKSIRNCCTEAIYDLSLYLGLPGQIDHPDVLSLFKSISTKVLSAGYKLGSIANSLSQAEFLINSDVKFLAYSVDSYMLKNSYQKIIKEIKTR